MRRSSKLSPKHITLAYWVRPDGFVKGQDVVSQSPAGSYLVQGYPNNVFHSFRIRGKLRQVAFPYTAGECQHVALTYDGRRLKGALDDVRIYDRALTPDEIKGVCAVEGSDDVTARRVASARAQDSPKTPASGAPAKKEPQPAVPTPAHRASAPSV